MKKHISKPLVPPRKQWPVSTVLLCLILLIGALLRLWNVNHGLPYHSGPDENFFLKPALQILISHNLNPHWFGHPGTPFIYILSVTYWIFGTFQVALGNAPDLTEYLNHLQGDAIQGYLVGRLVNVVFSVLSVYLTYLLGKRLFNARIALLAAGIIAFSPVHIEWTQIMRSDILLGFLYLSVILGCVSLAESGSWENYVFAGCLLGLAAATKYPASLLAFSIIAAHLARWWPDWREIISKSTRLITAGLASAAALFIGSPYLFLDYKNALLDLTRVSKARWWFHFADSPLETLFVVCFKPVSEGSVFGRARCDRMGHCLVPKEKGPAAMADFRHGRHLSASYRIASILLEPIHCSGAARHGGAVCMRDS